VKRSNLAGWAGYSYCPSRSRFFWGLRLHLITTTGGLPITWALADPKLDERQVLMAVLDHDPTLSPSNAPGLTVIADKGYVSAERRPVPRRTPGAAAAPILPQPHAPARLAPAQTRPPIDRVGFRHPQKANSTSNSTAAAPSTESVPGSGSDYSP
jgi:hypothetical protein